ncbi:hypothetical protein T12_5943 [Trichinella patagoniensis]|uniref:Uncharacterized protein n=1 Tax=Trichinella patagoniensis TaxID=990121 RepID=A0A0V0Z8X8_9BILA|nr:hypothetical protein T12_5943 [Trichinella patagoniensis]
MNKSVVLLNKKIGLLIKGVTVTLAMRMSNPGKKEASGILETAVHGRRIAIPEQYSGSSDWDDWLEHFEDVDAVNG